MILNLFHSVCNNWLQSSKFELCIRLLQGHQSKASPSYRLRLLRWWSFWWCCLCNLIQDPSELQELGYIPHWGRFSKQHNTNRSFTVCPCSKTRLTLISRSQGSCCWPEHLVCSRLWVLQCTGGRRLSSGSENWGFDGQPKISFWRIKQLNINWRIWGSFPYWLANQKILKNQVIEEFEVHFPIPCLSRMVCWP